MNKKNLHYFLSVFFILFITDTSFANSQSEPEKNETRLGQQCEDALEWYKDNPGLRGEYVRVLDYCKKYAKDVSPEGFQVNPILSDFGSMNGVNTRPRDTIHQGIDIIGPENQEVIAIADGKVLEATIEDCWGSTLIIDHGKSIDGKKLITIYGHVGEFLVKENETVKRGDSVAKLPKKVEFRCMARVRHLHLQIGQRYCKKEEKDNWGCKYFIKDYYRSLNPHKYWANGPNNVACFDKDKDFEKGTITYPFECKKVLN